MSQAIITEGEDGKTLDYFDRFTPHYNPARFQFAIDFLKANGTASQRLLDIGCGDGATLYLLEQNTPVRGLCGLDISANYLRKAEQLVGCQTIEGSILDDALVGKHAGQFDYCTLGAVIHHLIGKDRRESFQFAEQCMRNSFRLLKPGGALLIFEPTYRPAWLMSVAFWIKKIVTRFSDNRVEIMRKWANLGQPIVSYYTDRQITDLARSLPEADVLQNDVLDRLRLCGVIQRKGLGLIIRKRS